MKQIPKTWFSTSLTGTAGELEERLRALFGKAKKRPPALVLASLALGVGLCGNLISCQQAQAVPEISANLTERADPAVTALTTPSQNTASATSQPDSVSAPPPEGQSVSMKTLSPLTQTVMDEYPTEQNPVVAHKLVGISGEGNCTFGAIDCNDSYHGSTLAIGIVEDNHILGDGVFISARQGGQAHTTTWSKDGIHYILYTHNGMGQGYSHGDAGLIAFDGRDMKWLWPVEGDLRDKNGEAYQEYWEYWENHKALLCDGGVEVFSENPDFVLAPSSPVQWTPEYSQLFYGGWLPTGVAWKVREWLEEYSRDEHNPWNAINTSATWYIESLERLDTDWMGPEHSGAGTYRLVARADNNNSLCLGAILILDDEHHVTVQSCQIGTYKEVMMEFSLLID